jgi:hypothetical protein
LSCNLHLSISQTRSKKAKTTKTAAPFDLHLLCSTT